MIGFECSFLLEFLTNLLHSINEITQEFNLIRKTERAAECLPIAFILRPIKKKTPREKSIYSCTDQNVNKSTEFLLHITVEKVSHESKLIHSTN